MTFCQFKSRRRSLERGCKLLLGKNTNWPKSHKYKWTLLSSSSFGFSKAATLARIHPLPVTMVATAAPSGMLKGRLLLSLVWINLCFVSTMLRLFQNIVQNIVEQCFCQNIALLRIGKHCIVKKIASLRKMKLPSNKSRSIRSICQAHISLIFSKIFKHPYVKHNIRGQFCDNRLFLLWWNICFRIEGKKWWHTSYNACCANCRWNAGRAPLICCSSTSEGTMRWSGEPESS